jgi:hypothetical protein
MTHGVRPKMIRKLHMLKPNKVWACLILTLALSITSLATANEETNSPVEQLAQDFVMAFNSGDSDTMASFYKHGASTAFNERRTEEENRALFQILVDKFGTLTYKTVHAQESAGARLLAVASKPGKSRSFVSSWLVIRRSLMASVLESTRRIMWIRQPLIPPRRLIMRCLAVIPGMDYLRF